MTDAIKEESHESPANLSPELTKHFRGLRMWMPLMLHGISPFIAALEEKYLLCRYFYDKIQELHFEVGPIPDLSVAIYRFVPAERDSNDFNLELLEKIKRDGRIFVSSTILNDQVWLRIAILNFRTHLDLVDLYLKILTKSFYELKKEWGI